MVPPEHRDHVAGGARLVNCNGGWPRTDRTFVGYPVFLELFEPSKCRVDWWSSVEVGLGVGHTERIANFVEPPPVVEPLDSVLGISYLLFIRRYITESTLNYRGCIRLHPTQDHHHWRDGPRGRLEWHGHVDIARTRGCSSRSDSPVKTVEVRITSNII